MAYKMKGAPMQDTSSNHGTNANYKKSGAPGFMSSLMDPLGLKNKIGGLFGKGGGKPCPPAAPAAQAPPVDAPAQPVTAAPVVAAPAVAEEAVPAVPMKKNLKLNNK